MHARVRLHGSDEGPVGFALVHLTAGPTVDRERPDACVLQAFRQLHDDSGLVVPAEPGLHGHRPADRLDDAPGDRHHLVRLPHHPGAGPPDGDLAHRAAEIDVDDIGPVPSDQFGSMVGHPGSLDHRVRIAAVDLDPHGSLRVRSHQLRIRLPGIPDQPFRRNELRVDHVRPLLPADLPEGSVRHVLHRRKQHRPLTQIDVSDVHGRSNKKVGVVHPACETSVSLDSSGSDHVPVAINLSSSRISFSLPMIPMVLSA